MPFIDFAAVKAAVSIEEAVRKLNLQVTKSGAQLRAPCPTCKSGGERALAITPAKNLFMCFASGGDKRTHGAGDQIALVAHIKGCETREAAEWLAGTVTVQSTSTTVTVSKDHATGFQPLDYLVHDHEAVEALGFEPQVAQALGIGYAPKGILRGTVAVPIRLPDGTLAGYVGATELKLPNRWHLPEDNVVTLPQKRA